MNRIIYRVDDRFIHGQILEGWVNYLNIPNIMIVNDVLSGDKIRTNIYKSVLPESSKLSVYSIDDFCKKQPVSKIKKNYVMIIVDSVHDLLSLKKAFNDDIYINIGCVVSKEYDICVTDTVFLRTDELESLKELASSYEVHVHKVSWEKPVILSKFIGKVQNEHRR